MNSKTNNNLFQKIKGKLTSLYLDKVSENRINELAKNLMNIIENTNEKLDDILFFVDEFEGGASDTERFESILAFIIEKLTVNKENAQRLFDFFQHCQNMNVYVALTRDYCDYLTEEQKRFLPLTCPFLYAGKP